MDQSKPLFKDKELFHKMHEIEPFYKWENIYNPVEDEKSPFYGTTYAGYELSLYNHLIHPLWDYIGSETLYVKVLFADYQEGFSIIEILGEWNDIMHLKRNLIDPQLAEGITRFLLIGENVLNFHGSEDDYYQEWFEEVEDGWIVAMGFRDYIHREWSKFNLDFYLNWGGNLEIENWRTMSPKKIITTIDLEIRRRLN
jgi:hypothetical protein